MAIKSQDLKMGNLSSLIGSSSSCLKIPSNSLNGVRVEVLGVAEAASEEGVGSSAEEIAGSLKTPLPRFPGRLRLQEAIELTEEESPHHEASVLG